VKIGLSSSVIQRGRTGIAQYFFALLRAFLPHAGQHRFALFVLEEDLPLFDFVADQMEIIPVPERFRPPANNIFWHQTALPRLARRHQLDVLHIPSYRRLLWPRPCPLVATIHDLAPFRVPGKYDRARMLYGRVVARWLAQRQDRIIAVSRNTARDLAAFFHVPAHRLTIIPNGLDHARFHPASRETSRAELAARDGICGPFFLYLARLEHPAKNHVRLISAFNQFKHATHSSWRLVLGGSDWHGADVIHAAIRHSPFAGDIRTLGFVADADLPALYRAADVFIYPSLYEGFGMPPTEAMACGCPVICSTRGSLGEVVGQAAATVEPENINSITVQMCALAGDAQLRDRLANAGLGQARKFNWEHTAAETLGAYERAVRACERTPVRNSHRHSSRHGRPRNLRHRPANMA
jgi:glycosyltransferase involved in cell wall biosynthesis